MTPANGFAPTAAPTKGMTGTAHISTPVFEYHSRKRVLYLHENVYSPAPALATKLKSRAPGRKMVAGAFCPLGIA